MNKKIEMIVAMDDTGVIGKAGGMPWGKPVDGKRFRAKTLGKSVIMGRKTFESIGSKPLPDRQNIVITSNNNWQSNNVTVAHSIKEALTKSLHEPIVIGGAEVYRQFLPETSKIYVTVIHGKWEGDTHFPLEKLVEFKETSRETTEPDQKTPFRLSFVTYERPIR